jgi:DNA-binding MarR family transcriptional regulator
MAVDRGLGEEATDALMATSRLITAVVARTIAQVPETVTVPQLRVLVMLATRGPLNMGTVAAGLAVNPSNATRTCDKLVDAGLVTRSTDPADRRRGVLELTSRGEGLVSSLMEARRAVLQDLVSRMPDPARQALVRGLEALLESVEQGPDVELFGEVRGPIMHWPT